MREFTQRAGVFLAAPEYAEIVADGRAAQMRDPHADLYGVRKSDACEIGAACLDDETHHRAGSGVENAGLDKELVHRRVEEGVINDIIDVTVDVVVVPAGGRRHECTKVAAGPGLRAAWCRWRLHRIPMSKSGLHVSP